MARSVYEKGKNCCRKSRGSGILRKNKHRNNINGKRIAKQPSDDGPGSSRLQKYRKRNAQRTILLLIRSRKVELWDEKAGNEGWLRKVGMKVSRKVKTLASSYGLQIRSPEELQAGNWEDRNCGRMSYLRTNMLGYRWRMKIDVRLSSGRSVFLAA